jgi:hypothetical protein
VGRFHSTLWVDAPTTCSTTFGDAAVGGAVFTRTLPLAQQDSAGNALGLSSVGEVPVTGAAHRFDGGHTEWDVDVAPQYPM